METIELAIGLRGKFGKGAAREMRRQGKVPAVLYGPKRETVAVEFDAKEFVRKIANLEGSHLIKIESGVAELSGRLALVKEMQRDPVTRDVLHADLYEVDLTRKLRLRVPLHFIGKAAGVERGGILQPIQREVEVLCLPTDIPDFIEVDVSALDIHDTVHVSQITAPAGVELQFDQDDALVTVLPPTVEEVKVAAEAAVEGAPVEGAPTEEQPAAAGKEAAKGAAAKESGKGTA